MRLAIFAALALACTAALALVAPAGGASDASSPVRDAAARWAERQNGLTENGTSNCGPRINAWQRDMGLRVPPCRVWCGAFVHQAFLRAGIELSARLIDPHRSYLDAVAGRRGLRQIDVEDVRRGDIVFYKFRSGVRASHLAIARGRPRGDSLSTVEGNTSHAVRLEQRGLEFIVLAARVTVS